MDSFFKKETRFPCPPNMHNIERHTESYASEDDDIEEAQETVSCVEDFLNLYNLFVTGTPPNDSLVNKIYDKTNKMIKGAISSRKTQKSHVEYRLEDYKENIKTCCGDEAGENEYYWKAKAAIFEGNAVLKGFEDDFAQLNELKSFCENANDKTQKILCVEKFVNTAHTRGTYISTGCGGIFPESLSDELEGNEQLLLLEKITMELEDETSDVLDCLRNYKP